MSTVEIQVLIPFLDAIVNYDGEWFKDRDNVSALESFLDRPFDEWNVMDAEPAVLYEILSLTALVNSQIANDQEDNNELIGKWYRRWFGVLFYDVDPSTPLSPAGWMNVSWCRQHETKYDHLPTASLHNINDWVEFLVELSPTSDETLPEHMNSMLAEFNENADIEGSDEYFFNDLNDQCFELSKLINKRGGENLLSVIEISSDDDITMSLSEEAIYELQELVSTILNYDHKDQHPVHAITLLQTCVERMVNDANDLKVK